MDRLRCGLARIEGRAGRTGRLGGSDFFRFQQADPRRPALFGVARFQIGEEGARGAAMSAAGCAAPGMAVAFRRAGVFRQPGRHAAPEGRTDALRPSGGCPRRDDA